MREALIKSDLVECVIGLGPNLFFNASMEACIVICKMQKEPKQRGKILLIGAIDEVTRKNSQSFLEERHIEKIADAYKSFVDIEGFSKVISEEDAKRFQFSLNISLYVTSNNVGTRASRITISEAFELWNESRHDMLRSFEDLFEQHEVGDS